MESLRIGTQEARQKIPFKVNGKEYQAYEGYTVAAALWACGTLSLNKSLKNKEPRGCLCGMGVCYGCLVTINGEPGIRACMTELLPGMEIQCDEA